MIIAYFIKHHFLLCFLSHLKFYGEIDLYIITYTKMMSWHHIEKMELVLFLMNNSLQQFLKIWFREIICPFIYSTSYYLPITVQFCQSLFICLTTWHNSEVVLLIKHAFSRCSKNYVYNVFLNESKT